MCERVCVRQLQGLVLPVVLSACMVVIVLMELRAGTDGAQYLCVLLFAGRILSTASA